MRKITGSRTKTESCNSLYGLYFISQVIYCKWMQKKDDDINITFFHSCIFVVCINLPEQCASAAGANRVSIFNGFVFFPICIFIICNLNRKLWKLYNKIHRLNYLSLVTECSHIAKMKISTITTSIKFN